MAPRLIFSYLNLYIFFSVFFAHPFNANALDKRVCPASTTNAWDDCFGQSVFPNSDVYAGFWKDGLMHGFGVYQYFNGNRYIGDFNRHSREGVGLIFKKTKAPSPESTKMTNEME